MPLEQPVDLSPRLWFLAFCSVTRSLGTFEGVPLWSLKPNLFADGGTQNFEVPAFIVGELFWELFHPVRTRVWLILF